MSNEDVRLKGERIKPSFTIMGFWNFDIQQRGYNFLTFFLVKSFNYDRQIALITIDFPDS